MSLKSGRVGVNPENVNPVNGKIIITEDTLSAYQKKQLSTVLNIGSVECHTVEGSLQAIVDIISTLS